MPRTRSFDEDAVLDAAIEVFWTRGYRAASLSELSARTGLGNGSLYQAWGSKWELFRAAHRRYCAGRVRLIEGACAGADADVAGVARAVLDAVVADCRRHPDRRGCLMINAVSELGSHDDIARVTREATAAMEDAVAAAISRAGGGALSDRGLRAAAAHVIALSQSAIQLTRVGRDAGDVRSMTDQAAVSVAAILRAA